MARKVCVALTTYVFLALLLISTLARAPQVRLAPQGTGREWLSWTENERSVFVDAYLNGYLRGKTDACIAAAQLFESNKAIHDLEGTPDARCFRQAKSYSKHFDYYESVITAFYSKYPELRGIPDLYLMLLLIDGRYATAEEIHQAALKGEIRTSF